MCAICGCASHVESHDHDHDHDHSHGHTHGHDHAHGHTHAAATSAHGSADARRVSIEQDLLARNDAQARLNRARLDALGVVALNFVSSPGSGKTTLLEKTILGLAGRIPMAVIEGDQQTSRDAERIRAAGAPAVQVNTGKGCHLDADMVANAIARLPLARGGLLMIENVGNLVCPAAFDLGETRRVVILSVTEGEDKPLKYPDMFRASDLMILNKCDLLPYVDFDVSAAEAYARRVNPGIRILTLSARTGEGLDPWLDWLSACGKAPRGVQRVKDTGTAQ